MGKFFDDLKQGMQEAVLFEKGKKTLRTHWVEVPLPPANYTARDIRRIRKKALNCSQSVFSRVLNVSVKTVQSWESGERNPSHAALRLLELIEKRIYQPEWNKKSA